MVNGLFLQPIAFMWKQFLILVVLVNYSRFKKIAQILMFFGLTSKKELLHSPSALNHARLKND